MCKQSVPTKFETTVDTIIELIKNVGGCLYTTGTGVFEGYVRDRDEIIIEGDEEVCDVLISFDENDDLVRCVDWCEERDFDTLEEVVEFLKTI